MRKIRSTILFLLILFSGCLENRVAPELNLITESAIEFLAYLESKGDYINSFAINDFVSAAKVYANRNSYSIIDVRSNSEFIQGHIENAINIQPQNLFEYVKSIKDNPYPKIVIVSESGQSSAYYTALFQLIDYSNVYSMEYGMAVWHQDFAGIWLNAVRDFRAGHNHFTNEEYSKTAFINLPQISVQGGSVSDKIQNRVKQIIAAGFDEKLVDSSNFPKHSDLANPSIIVETIYNNYQSQTNSFPDYFLVCFGHTELYKAHKMNGPFADQGHLPTAVHFLPMLSLRSTNDLQTLPNSKPVVIYDVNGLVAPKITAYLRLLGYDARSLLFGANNLFYSRVDWAANLKPFAFKPEMIMNFPFVTGK